MERNVILTQGLIDDAVEAFRQQLLSSDVSPHIIKIIQFGSTSRGEISKNSDVDILVI